MINNVLRVAIYCLVFLSIQVLVLNNIHFLRLATPFLYVYILLKMPVGTQPVRLLLLAFFTGLVVDSFTNTAGMLPSFCISFQGNRLRLKSMASREKPAATLPSASSLSDSTLPLLLRSKRPKTKRAAIREIPTPIGCVSAIPLSAKYTVEPPLKKVNSKWARYRPLSCIVRSETC